MVKHAIILAGGKGERLRPYTDKLPKPMIPVLGRPLIEYQIIWLKQQGVEHIVFATGYKHDKILEYLKDGLKWGMKFDYTIEDKPLGRGGAFKNALKFIPENVELIVGANGDELTGEPLEPAIEAHINHHAAGTILLTQIVSPFGVVELNKDNLVTSFGEKPILPDWISIGVYIINRSTIEKFPDVGDHEDTTFPQLAKEGKLYGYPITTNWTTINSIKELNEANKNLPKRLSSYMLPKN